MANPETDRISINYLTHYARVDNPNCMMFKEDFALNVVPISRRNRTITCKFEPNNQEFYDSLASMLPMNSRTRHNDFTEMILKIIEHIAKQLIYNGQLILEFVTTKESSDCEKFFLETIYGLNIEIKKKQIIQYLHIDTAKQIGKTKSTIPIEKCIIIEFPKLLGGNKKYLKFLMELNALENQNPVLKYNPAFAQERKFYNLSEHIRLYEIELWRKSKYLNWHHRETSNDNFSSYYLTYRHLLFRRNQLLLRDYIVKELYTIVSFLSEKYKCKFELIIEGMTPISKIDELIKKWETGKVNSNEILIDLYQPPN